MKLYIFRQAIKDTTTDGVLKDEHGQRICDTAEHTHHMLPRGTYRVTLSMHPSHKHRAPRVEPCGGPGAWIIHGNGVHAKAFGSSIITGDRLAPGAVIRSRPYFERLVKRMEKAFKRGGQVELVIVEPPHVS